MDIRLRHCWSATTTPRRLHSLPCCWPQVSSSSRQIMVCLSPSRIAASIDSMPRKRTLMRLASRSDRSANARTEGGVGEGVPSGKRKVPVSSLSPSLPVSRAGGNRVKTSGGARGFDGSKDGNVSTFLCGPRSLAVGGGGAKGLMLLSVDGAAINPHGWLWRVNRRHAGKRVDDHERRARLPLAKKDHASSPRALPSLSRRPPTPWATIQAALIDRPQKPSPPATPA